MTELDQMDAALGGDVSANQSTDTGNTVTEQVKEQEVVIDRAQAGRERKKKEEEERLRAMIAESTATAVKTAIEQTNQAWEARLKPAATPAADPLSGIDFQAFGDDGAKVLHQLGSATRGAAISHTEQLVGASEKSLRAEIAQLRQAQAQMSAPQIPDEMSDYFDAPNDLIGGQTPRELIDQVVNRGDYALAKRLFNGHLAQAKAGTQQPDIPKIPGSPSVSQASVTLASNPASLPKVTGSWVQATRAKIAASHRVGDPEMAKKTAQLNAVIAKAKEAGVFYPSE